MFTYSFDSIYWPNAIFALFTQNLSFSASSYCADFFLSASFVISSMCTKFFLSLLFCCTHFMLINLYVRCLFALFVFIRSVHRRHSSETYKSAAALVSKWKFTLFALIGNTTVYSQLHFDVAISSGFYVFIFPFFKLISISLARIHSQSWAPLASVCNTFICGHLTRCRSAFVLYIFLQMHFYVWLYLDRFPMECFACFVIFHFEMKNIFVLSCVIHLCSDIYCNSQ